MSFVAETGARSDRNSREVCRAIERQKNTHRRRRRGGWGGDRSRDRNPNCGDRFLHLAQHVPTKLGFV